MTKGWYKQSIYIGYIIDPTKPSDCSEDCKRDPRS